MGNLIKKDQQLSITNNQLAVSKNKIVLASNCVKIRDYNEIDVKRMASITINYLLSLLGVQETDDNSKDGHYLVLFEFITETLTNYAFEEIKLAFNNCVKGEYDIKLFNKLDCVVVGKVMKAYDNQKINAIRNEMIRKQKIKSMESNNIISDEQNELAIIQGSKYAWHEVKRTGKLRTRTYLYHIFYEKGLLPTDNETKIAIGRIAKNNILNRRLASGEIIDKKRVLNELQNTLGSSDEMKTECYNLTLARFFKSFSLVEQMVTKISI